jgi:hypothetical protein
MGTELVFAVQPLQSPVNDLIGGHSRGGAQLMKSHGRHPILMHRINFERFYDLASFYVIQPRPAAVSALEIRQALGRGYGTFTCPRITSESRAHRKRMNGINLSRKVRKTTAHSIAEMIEKAARSRPIVEQISNQ